VTIGTGFPIYEGGEEGLLPSVNILRFHRSTLASTIQTTFTKVSTDLIPAAPLWLRDKAVTLERLRRATVVHKVRVSHLGRPEAKEDGRGE
jgi:hypothetical protein